MRRGAVSSPAGSTYGSGAQPPRAMKASAIARCPMPLGVDAPDAVVERTQPRQFVRMIAARLDRREKPDRAPRAVECDRQDRHPSSVRDVIEAALPRSRAR